MTTDFGIYRNCVVRPMAENGDGKPLVKPEHLIDAGIVAGIVFFSVLVGDALMGVAAGNVVLLTAEQVAQRLVTAGLAFGLTFFAQWARYRGIKLREAWLPGSSRPPQDYKDDNDND